MVAYGPPLERIPATKEADDMGKIVVKVKIINYDDWRDVERGRLQSADIRSAEVQGLVDTGATLMVIPTNIKAQLGLPTSRYAPVMYADGRTEDVPIVSAYVEIQERFALVECLVVPEGGQVLIGEVPLDVMDWHIDLRERTLKPRPESPDAPLMELMTM
jgi:clan AA aspartic protease